MKNSFFDDDYSSSSQSAFFTLSKSYPKKKTLLSDRLTNNLNAVRSLARKKSIDFDSNTQLSNTSSIEENEKSSYQIPNPIMFLPNELPSSSKPITNSNLILNKIHRSTPLETNRNLTIHNPVNSFHLKNHSLESNSDKISISSINSLSSSNVKITPEQSQIPYYETFTIHRSTRNSISSPHQIYPTKQSALILPRFIDKPILSNRNLFSNPRISISQTISDTHSNPTSILSQDLESPSFQLIHENMHPDFTLDTLSFETSSPARIKHEPESLWKTKLSLKTILSMANRDEAQALKDRKPIDYHMFLTNKFPKNSIFQYNDHIDTKFTSNNKPSLSQPFNNQDYKENRTLQKRLLTTMTLRRPVNTKNPESLTPIKQIKSRRRIKTKPSNSMPDDSLPYSNDKPVLITYQAVPISVFNN